MKKYEIYTDTFEFRFGRYEDSIPEMSGYEIFQTYLSCDTGITTNSLDPHLEASFDTLEEARAEWEKNYKNYGRTWAEKGNALWLLRGDIAYLEGNEYTEEGDFDQGGDVYECSAEPYEKEE